MNQNKLFQTFTRIFHQQEHQESAKSLRPTRSFSDPKSIPKHPQQQQRRRRYSAPTIQMTDRPSKRSSLSDTFSALVRKARRRNDWQPQTWTDVMPVQDMSSTHREKPENWWATSPPLCAAA